MVISIIPRSGEDSDEIGKQLYDRIHEIIQDNDLIGRSDSFRKVSEWYNEAEQKLDKIPKDQLNYLPDSGEIIDLAYSVKMGRDSFVSTIATLLVKKIVEHVKVPFVEITFDEIRVRTDEKKKQVEITNFETKLCPIKPVVTVTFQVFGIPQTFETKFQIDANVKIPSMTFSGTTTDAEVQIGRLIADVKISLLEIDIDSKTINTARTLGEKEIDVDLKGYKFSRLHSKQCHNCNTPNPATTKFCGECGTELET